MTSPGPVTPDPDELVAAFEAATTACLARDDHAYSRDELDLDACCVRAGVAAVEVEARAGERTRIADAIDAHADSNVLAGPDYGAGVEHAARIARGDTT